MLIPRRIRAFRERHSRAVLIADRDKWAAKYSEARRDSLNAETEARHAVERLTRAGLLVPMEEHDKALEKLRWDMEKAADENARELIEVWKRRRDTERERADRAETRLESLEADAVPRQAWEVADRRAQNAEADAAAWRLRAVTAENELAETEREMDTRSAAHIEAARESLRRRQEAAQAEAQAKAQAEHARQVADMRRHDKIRWDAWKARGQSVLAVAYPDGSHLCTLPPKGQWCPLDGGHAGPCPTRPVEVKL